MIILDHCVIVRHPNALVFRSLAVDNNHMQDRSSKQPEDQNQSVEPISPAERQAPPAAPGKNPAAVELGRRGGLKGGKARAAKLTAKERKEIAKKAAAARWQKK
jgi:hypothetical protein